jgi:hypothetical protein
MLAEQSLGLFLLFGIQAFWAFCPKESFNRFMGYVDQDGNEESALKIEDEVFEMCPLVFSITDSIAVDRYS